MKRRSVEGEPLPALRTPTADYEVGYGRRPSTPSSSQGDQATPEDDLRDTRIATILGRILAEKVTLREGDRVRTVTKAEAMVMTTVNRALKGDHRAMIALLGLARRPVSWRADRASSSSGG